MNEMVESIIPAEVEVLGNGKLVGGDESSVKQLVVRGSDGERKLFYKHPYEAGAQYSKPFKGHRIEKKPITYEEAIQKATELRSSYENAVLCFGKKGVATTSYVVGQDTTYPYPQVHVYQEQLGEDLFRAMGCSAAFPIPEEITPEELIRFKIQRGERMEELKKKAFHELDPQDPVEGPIRTQIEKHKTALRGLYSSCVESVLLGYIPDLQYWHEDGSYGRVGYVFNKNFAISGDPDGSERIKFFDFGEQRLNYLTLESRRRLRAILDEHKQRGELAVRKTETRYKDRLINTNYEFAPWYEDALRTELKHSISLLRNTQGNQGKDEGDLIDEAVKYLGNTVNLGRQYSTDDPIVNYHAKELESLRRLSEASEYASEK